MATLRKPTSHPSKTPQTKAQAKTPQKRGRKPTGQHDARLDFRLSSAAKAKIEQAALASGQSLSDFAASTLVREAEQVLERSAATILSERDWELFVALMQNPPQPGQPLKQFVEAYQTHTHTTGEVTVVDADLFDHIPAEFGLDPH